MTTLTFERSLPSDRLAEAFAYALEAHRKQYRKGSGVPYISHPMGVASLVLEYGGTENQAIAGFLHDVVEDCGEKHQEEIRQRFGDEVMHMVMGCTDGSQEQKKRPKTAEEKKAAWWERKTNYMAHLEQSDSATQLVSACDKLHNARSCLRDLRADGLSLYHRFVGQEDGTLWYYQTLVSVFEKTKNPVASALRTVVDTLVSETASLHTQCPNPPGFPTPKH